MVGGKPSMPANIMARTSRAYPVRICRPYAHELDLQYKGRHDERCTDKMFSITQAVALAFACGGCSIEVLKDDIVGFPRITTIASPSLGIRDSAAMRAKLSPVSASVFRKRMTGT